MDNERYREPEQNPLERKVGERTLNEWHEWLTGDDLAVPASRYGRRASEVAWWPLATLHVFEQYGEIDSSLEVFLNAEMSMVVNDYDSPEELVRENIDVIPKQLLENLNIYGEPIE